IGPHAALALGILFQRAIEAAAEHLAHHRVIIPARRCRLLKAPTRPPPRAGLPPPLAGEGWDGRVIIPARRCRLLKAPTRPPPRVGLPPPLAGGGWGWLVIIPAGPAGLRIAVTLTRRRASPSGTLSRNAGEG